MFLQEMLDREIRKEKEAQRIQELAELAAVKEFEKPWPDELYGKFSFTYVYWKKRFQVCVEFENFIHTPFSLKYFSRYTLPVNSSAVCFLLITSNLISDSDKVIVNLD